MEEPLNEVLGATEATPRKENRSKSHERGTIVATAPAAPSSASMENATRDEIMMTDGPPVHDNGDDQHETGVNDNIDDSYSGYAATEPGVDVNGIPDIASSQNEMTIHERAANGSDQRGAPRDKTTTLSRRKKNRKRQNNSKRHTGVKKGVANSTTTTKLMRKRGRIVRVAYVEDETSHLNDATTTPPNESDTTMSTRTTSMTGFPILPSNQYRTVLRRRAVRKLEEDADPSRQDQGEDPNKNLDEYGDISLGMKLIVAGGRVIVQALNPLSDGLASPAQLVGVIQRGDVLLAIGSLSLVNLPVDQLMEGLRPLSTPNLTTGTYERFLSLRFETATGMDLLRIHEKGQEALRHQTRPETADAMFSLFPMVDQLSGTPLFEDHGKLVKEETSIGKQKDDHHAGSDDSIRENADSSPSISVKVEDLGTLISWTLASERIRDRMRNESEFFNWKEDLSVLLGRGVAMVEEGDENRRLTKAERIALGMRIMQITKVLQINMEEIDKGRDLRSFKTWSTNFSLRSGVSARRKYVIDSTSVRSNRDMGMDDSGDDDSINSDDSGGSLEGVDADALLLGLAARDEIWRKQVIDVLSHAMEKVAGGPTSPVEVDEKRNGSHPNRTGIDAALTNQLGNFLFGQNMSKIVKQETKSYALPPREITRVLFDLTTNLATKAPDEITVFGASSRLSSTLSGSKSRSTRTENKPRAAIRADVLLANRFVLDEALPVWLKSFRPLPLEHRRILWPRTQRTSDSMTGTFTGNPSSSVDSDSLTLGSGGSLTQESHPNKKKDLRERVEDHQIDEETRSETCFLVTYFYTKKLLSTESNGVPSSVDATTFVEEYGAYLQIHSCITFAAAVKDESAIADLLKAASYDPNHRDAVKEIQKSNELLFYDSSKLSAVLQFLAGIRYENSEDRRKVVRDLCVSAYPDILPWMVQKACLPSLRSSLDAVVTRIACPDSIMEGIYYMYLTHLLNPLDGHDAARYDVELVEEWCKWSVGILPNPHKDPERLKNFFLVASRSSIQYKRYRRDLMMLLELTMIIGKIDLALDLVDEILDSNKLLQNQDTLHRTLVYLREIGDEALRQAAQQSTEEEGFRSLKGVLRLFEKISSSTPVICRKSIIHSSELYRLLEKEKSQSQSSVENPYGILDFVIEESSAPKDVLHALIMDLASSNEMGDELYPRLKKLLVRGVHLSKGELSGTLLHLKHARKNFILGPPEEASRLDNTQNIWHKMGNGEEAIIEK